ncbi:MAG: biopolymer transporter ExbD [Elusimicrobia bacterium]|nr:biopolymer transporter ExbD [Elusimicrobiota bacterium]
MHFNSEDDLVTGINVTPLVDVCLVLVIIFMVTAPILSQSTLAVILPKAKTREGEEKSSVTLTITGDGRWAVNETEYPLEKLKTVLPAKISETIDRLVIVRADREARHAQLMTAMGLAKESGARAITIATEQK